MLPMLQVGMMRGLLLVILQLQTSNLLHSVRHPASPPPPSRSFLPPCVPMEPRRVLIRAVFRVQMSSV